LSRDIKVEDYTRYLSSILAGLSIQVANGSTKAELKRTAQHGYSASGLRVAVVTSGRCASGDFAESALAGLLPVNAVALGNSHSGWIVGHSENAPETIFLEISPVMCGACQLE
jgi:hypothetical protein